MPVGVWAPGWILESTFLQPPVVPGALEGPISAVSFLLASLCLAHAPGPSASPVPAAQAALREVRSHEPDSAQAAVGACPVSGRHGSGHWSSFLMVRLSSGSCV